MSSENQKTVHQPKYNEITLKDLILGAQKWWRYLLSNWLIVLVAGLLGGVLGLAYSAYQKPTYTASLTFVLEEANSGGLSSLGGLAAIAGINVGSGNEGLFKGENIFELYKSRSMLSKTLLSKAAPNDSLLIDRYIAFNKLRDKWSEDSQLANISFAIAEDQFTLQHDSIMSQIVKSIKEKKLSVSKPDKKTSLIQVVTKSENERFAKDFTEVLVKNVNDFYVETKTKKSLENLKVLQHQTDSVRRELNSAIGGVASAIDVNPNLNPARQRLTVPSTRRQVDVQANQGILVELIKNLEMSKITLRQEMPLIQIVDKPILPLKKEVTGKIKSIVLGAFLLGFIVVLILILRRIYKNVLS